MRKLMDEFDGAILGRDVHEEVYIYSQDKMINIMMDHFGMSWVEAISDFEFNYQGARYKGSPIYLADF